MFQLKEKFPDNERVWFLHWTGYKWQATGPATVASVSYCSQRQTTYALQLGSVLVPYVPEDCVFAADEPEAAREEAKVRNAAIGAGY